MLTIKKKKGTDFRILNITDTHLVTVDWENPVLRDTFVATIDELVRYTERGGPCRGRGRWVPGLGRPCRTPRPQQDLSRLWGQRIIGG